MGRPKNIENLFKPEGSSFRGAERGQAGYDNARENIDPHIKTKVISAKEINKIGVDDFATQSINFIIDGGGSAITTGTKGFVEVGFDCTILQATLLADQSGSIKVDIWKDTYANFPPTNADTITAANEPEISAATKDQDSTLTGWTKTISAGDILGFNVDSCATITRCTLALKVIKR